MFGMSNAIVLGKIRTILKQRGLSQCEVHEPARLIFFSPLWRMFWLGFEKPGPAVTWRLVPCCWCQLIFSRVANVSLHRARVAKVRQTQKSIYHISGAHYVQLHTKDLLDTLCKKNWRLILYCFVMRLSQLRAFHPFGCPLRTRWVISAN